MTPTFHISFKKNAKIGLKNTSGGGACGQRRVGWLNPSLLPVHGQGNEADCCEVFLILNSLEIHLVILSAG